MQSNKTFTLIFAVLMTISAAAQVLAPAEMDDTVSRNLQQRYLPQLKAAGTEIRAHKFPYPFYLSRVLDIDQSLQAAADQRAIRFDRYDHRRVLEITGNYFASYSAITLDRNQRARRTFNDVMLPLLQSIVPRLADAADFQAYAIEVSHHVRKPVLGVNSENPENLVLILPRQSAKKLVLARNAEDQQAALLEGEAFFDGEPFLLWLRDDAEPPADWEPPSPPPSTNRKRQRVQTAAENDEQIAPEPTGPLVSPRLLQMPEFPVRVVNAETLGNLEARYMDLLPRMVKELDSQAHFNPSAPPSFIAFRQSAYLQFAMSTNVDSPAASQYRMAAMAFDSDVAHLVRPMLKYIPADPGFDGINFSLTVRSAASQETKVISVEYLLPMKALRCYEAYDCTGQQLLNAGTVLINGDRVGLDLQTAEEVSSAPRQ